VDITSIAVKSESTTSLSPFAIHNNGTNSRKLLDCLEKNAQRQFPFTREITTPTLSITTRWSRNFTPPTKRSKLGEYIDKDALNNGIARVVPMLVHLNKTAISLQGTSL
jgi:hypothetical protein